MLRLQGLCLCLCVCVCVFVFVCLYLLFFFLDVALPSLDPGWLAVTALPLLALFCVLCFVYLFHER